MYSVGEDDGCNTEAFLKEALLMRKFNHPNVLSLLGVSVHNDIPCAVLPLMSNGDLKTYMKKNSVVSTRNLFLLQDKPSSIFSNWPT